MGFLSLSDVLSVSGPERERLLEADDAIRDVVTLVIEQAEEDGLDGELMSGAMLDLLLIAAAKLALVQGAKSLASAQSDDFADMARQALEWAAARATPNAINPPRAPRRAP